MGIEPYLVASALEGVIAQRLVRRRAADGSFHGRIAISEIMTVNTRMKDLILEQRNGSTLRTAALSDGMTGLYQDGLKKSENGLTTVGEVERTVVPD